MSNKEKSSDRNLKYVIFLSGHLTAVMLLIFFVQKLYILFGDSSWQMQVRLLFLILTLILMHISVVGFILNSRLNTLTKEMNEVKMKNDDKSREIVDVETVEND